MSDARWEKLLKIVETARELPATEQQAFLVDAVEDDLELLEEARGLLRDQAPLDFLEPPVEPAAEPSGALIGSVLGGYRIESVIGSGGMGVVYRARREEGGQAVALKVLPAIQRARPAASERFRRESLIARHVSHDAVVEVFDEGTSSDHSWFAMAWIEGHDLAEELALHRAVRRGEEAAATLLPPFDSEHYVGAALRLVVHLAKGLAHGHGKGVLHRDIKPKNVLLDRKGRAYLGDFGLARLDDLATITRSGDVQGTPHYMSPEQARVTRRPVDARSDQYSLGVVLFELLALELPYQGRSSREVLDKISTGPARRLQSVNPHLPRDLSVICEKAIARRPSERYVTCTAFADDLERVLARRSIQARPQSLASRIRESVQRHRVVVAVSVSAAVAAAVVALALAWHARSSRVDRNVAAMKRALAAPVWSPEDGDLLRWIEAARQAAEAEDGRSSSALIAQFRTRSASERSRWALMLKADVQAGLGGAVDPTRYGGLLSPPNEAKVLRAQEVATRLVRLFPSDEALAALARPESTFPLVSIDLAAPVPGATALAIPRDPVLEALGEPRELGSVPLEARLEPGDWRIVVLGPDGQLAEHDRHLVRRAAPYEIRAMLRSPAEVVSDMVKIPATRPVFPEERAAGCRLAPGPVDLAGYWMDEAEVSNRDYLEFMDATGHVAPRFWVVCGYAGDWRTLPGVEGRERWLELPAVGMNLYGMKAYAEWRGKRLPNHLEAEIALRGEGLAESFQGNGALANVGGPKVTGGANPGRYIGYVEAALPVREPGYRQPPYGLFHIYGNVAEFTSSRFVQSHQRDVRVHVYENVRMLTDWDDLTAVVQFYSHGPTGIGDLYVAPTTGFRCARSIQPER